MDVAFKNSYKDTQKEMVSLSVYNVGYQRCNPLYQWGPGVRDHYLIHYVVSGKGRYQVGEKEYSLRAGDVFLVYPNVSVTYFSDREEPWEYYWVGFNGSDAAYLLNSAGFEWKEPVRRSIPFGKELQKRLLAIYDVRGNSLAHAAAMTGELYRTLALFLQNAPQQEEENDPLALYTMRAVEYINFRYSYPITVDEIAAYVGVSRSHLYRAFHTVTGQSPKTYLSRFRIRQACLLLEKGDMSIAAIAQSVGYESGLYFSKVFHRLEGMTPSEYAKRFSGKSNVVQDSESIPPV